MNILEDIVATRCRLNDPIVRCFVNRISRNIVIQASIISLESVKRHPKSSPLY